MTWHISWVVNLGAGAIAVIAIIVVALAYLVYLGVLKAVEEGKREPDEEGRDAK